MKTLFYISILLLGTYSFAQTKPVDEMKTTQIKTQTVEEDGKLVTKQVKVVTEKKQEVKTDPSKSGQIDAPMIETPTKVTKTISVNTNNNGRFKALSKITYYTFNDHVYGLQTTNTGYELSRKVNNKNMPYGTARRTQNKDIYVITTKHYSGVGYFNQNNDFIIEYYDKDKKMIQQQSLTLNTH